MVLSGVGIKTWGSGEKIPPDNGEQNTPLTCTATTGDTLTQDEEEVRKVPSSSQDGGWGWMVVVGCFIMSLLMDGLGKSYGVIYVQVKAKFQGSAAMTAWIGGANSGLRMALGNKFE